MVQWSRICILQGTRTRILNVQGTRVIIVQGSRVGVVQCAMCLLEVPKCFNSQHAPYCAKTSFQDKHSADNLQCVKPWVCVHGTAAHFQCTLDILGCAQCAQCAFFMEGKVWGNVLLPMPWAPPLVPKMPPTRPSHERILFLNIAHKVGRPKIQQDPSLKKRTLRDYKNVNLYIYIIQSQW